MVDYKITYYVVDNVEAIYHCKSYSIIATSRRFSRNVLRNIANSIYPDQTDRVGSVSTLIEPILSTNGSA